MNDPMHEWIPSENDTRRHCKYCGIYEDYTNAYPQCQPQEKPVLEEAADILEDIADAADWKGASGNRAGFTRIRVEQGERMREIAAQLRRQHAESEVNQ